MICEDGKRQERCENLKIKDIWSETKSGAGSKNMRAYMLEKVDN